MPIPGFSNDSLWNLNVSFLIMLFALSICALVASTQVSKQGSYVTNLLNARTINPHSFIGHKLTTFFCFLGQFNFPHVLSKRKKDDMKSRWRNLDTITQFFLLGKDKNGVNTIVSLTSMQSTSGTRASQSFSH